MDPLCFSIRYASALMRLMCGICGIFLVSPLSSVSLSGGAGAARKVEDALIKMTRQLGHRGPDDDGFAFIHEAGLYFGHRRLAVVALGEEGRQPLSSYTDPNRKGRIHLTYNGELYDFQKLSQQLGQAGNPVVDTGSDTRVLVQWLSQFSSLSALNELNGMFAFAAFDDGKKELQLVRDPMGQKPLYFAALKGRGLQGTDHLDSSEWQSFEGDLVFASEAKAIVCNEHFDDDIDDEILDHCLRFGVARGLNRSDEMRTLYRRMWQVPPGTRLLFRRRQGCLEMKAERYFDVHQEAQAAQNNPYSHSFQEAVDDVEKVLREAVHRRCLADVPLGAFLSGGIDSALIAAFMREAKTDVQTFTIGFSSKSWVATDESDDAARVAKCLGTSHHKRMVTGKDALDVVPKLASMYDFPFADASAIPTFLVSAFAREKVTVSLSGDGADELFGGYARYGWTRSALTALAPFSAGQRGLLHKLLEKMAPVLDAESFSKIRKRLPASVGRRASADTAIKLAALAKLANADDVYRAFLTQWEDHSLLADNAFNTASSSLRLPPGDNLEKRLMLSDLTAYLPDDILQKVDRASMATSLEARAPFLDKNVVRMALSLPTPYLLSKRQNKKVLRAVLARHLPPSAIDPGKRGFGVPLDDWLRNDLREWAEDLLSVSELKKNGLRSEVIRRRWRAHLKGERSFHYSLWNVLMVQDFMRARRQRGS